MSEHVVDLSWSRGDREFEYRSYSRDHTWAFDGGETYSLAGRSLVVLQAESGTARS